MEPTSSRISLKGPVALVIAIGVVTALLIALPVYRWFFLISVGIGLVVAAILFLWHRLRPIQEKDFDNKRPLGLE
jgi:hypothetical protein